MFTALMKKKKRKAGSKRETVRKLLEPFGKDQLIDILKEAALKNRSIIDRISQAAELDPTHRKIFVHNLGWDATNETLISVFKEYGQIEECRVVTDKLTGKSKGYGFILFKTREGAVKSLKQPQKKIGNRMTSCQLASQGPVPNHLVPDATGRKILVSNVGQHVHPEKLRAFFAQFGEIEEGPLGSDRITGKLKGFALFVYKTSEGCKKALEEPVKLFEGCSLRCQRAVEGNKGNKNQVGEKLVGSSGSGVLQPNNRAVGSSGSGVLQPNNLAVGSSGSGVLQPNNLVVSSYAMGYPGIVSQSLTPTPAAALVGQNQGLGVLYPAALGSSMNHLGLLSSVGSGLSPAVNRSATTPTYGLGAVGLGGQSGINSISPSVIGNYGSQAALQGLGAYQSAQAAQLGQSSRSQSGIGSLGTMPPYFGR
ncbi:RNA recognition motif domain [Macleaya cordata]|uniref:RNA recognition motif domain n=1 Tax=Macleaya cordata TaxID=56857 RepID=A0A200RAB6_MACCD|nr:RNA recognition motif domain [Macleaya cordata]